MATLTAIAHNVFETIGRTHPRIGLMVCGFGEDRTKRKPLRMRWVHDHDAQGHDILRIQWVEEAEYNKPLNIPNRRR